MNKQKLLISFSGGRTSAYMTWWLLKNLQHQYEMLVVYANTGKERLETLDFINKCDTHFKLNLVWVEAITNNEFGKGVTAKIVDYQTASRNGEPFEAVIAKHGIPNTNQPMCTRELKAYCIKNYCKQIGFKNYQLALGIRIDEPQRLNWEKAKKENIIFPFATMKPTTKSDVNLWWSKQPFDLELKSFEGNCDLCWKKSDRKLFTILKEHPEFADWYREMENKYSMYVPATHQHNEKIKPPIYFFRGNRSVDDMLEESKLQLAENDAKDESKDFDKFKQMSLWNYELDANNGCVESCEVFL